MMKKTIFFLLRYESTHSKSKNEDAKLIASYEVLRLAQNGYNHGDLHENNILINMDYEN